MEKTALSRKTAAAIVAAVLLIAAVTALFLRFSRSDSDFNGKVLVCAFALGRSDDSTTALLTGYNHELLKRFAEQEAMQARFVPLRDSVHFAADSLLDGKLDILVFPFNVTVPEGLVASAPIDSSSVWLVRKDRTKALAKLNAWIERRDGDEAHSHVKKRFYGAVHDPARLARNGKKRQFLSPYDSLFRVYAPQLGWDWRLLAALSFKESKFRIDAAHRGAFGLMQMKPETALAYGLENSLDPEDNIRTGVKYLAALKRTFAKQLPANPAPGELERFVLAAYNGGEGRMAEYIETASSLGLYDSTWACIKALPPALDSLSGSEQKALALKKMNAYADDVMHIYDSFRKICP